MSHFLTDRIESDLTNPADRLKQRGDLPASPEITGGILNRIYEVGMPKVLNAQSLLEKQMLEMEDDNKKMDVIYRQQAIQGEAHAYCSENKDKLDLEKLKSHIYAQLGIKGNDLEEIAKVEELLKSLNLRDGLKQEEAQNRIQTGIDRLQNQAERLTSLSQTKLLNIQKLMQNLNICSDFVANMIQSAGKMCLTPINNTRM